MERDLLNPPASQEKLGVFARKLGISQESEEFREMVRLASLGRGEIPPSILSDKAVLAKLPVLFRTLEGDRVDDDVLDVLFDILRKE